MRGKFLLLMSLFVTISCANEQEPKRQSYDLGYSRQLAIEPWGNNLGAPEDEGARSWEEFDQDQLFEAYDQLQNTQKQQPAQPRLRRVGSIQQQQQPAQAVAADVAEIQVAPMELATTLDLVSCPTCRLSFDTDYELNEHMLITPGCNTAFANGPVQHPQNESVQQQQQPVRLREDRVPLTQQQPVQFVRSARDLQLSPSLNHPSNNNNNNQRSMLEIPPQFAQQPALPAQGVAAPVEEVQVDPEQLLATTLDLVSCPTCFLSFYTDDELNEHMFITPGCNTAFANGPVQQPVQFARSARDLQLSRSLKPSNNNSYQQPVVLPSHWPTQEPPARLAQQSIVLPPAGSVQRQPIQLTRSARDLQLSRSLKPSNNNSYQQPVVLPAVAAAAVEEEEIVEDVNNQVQEKHICEWGNCKQEFENEEGFRDHVKYHAKNSNNNNDENKFKCEWIECSKSFINKCNLIQHLTTHTGERYACTFSGCNQNFAQPSSRDKHMQRIHNVNNTFDKKFVCNHKKDDGSVCGNSFNDKFVFERHQNIHTNKRPFQCPQCPASFKDPSNLKQHLKIHNGEKQHVCAFPGCDSRFLRFSDLTRHKKLRNH